MLLHFSLRDLERPKSGPLIFQTNRSDRSRVKLGHIIVSLIWSPIWKCRSTIGINLEWLTLRNQIQGESVSKISKYFKRSQQEINLGYSRYCCCYIANRKLYTVSFRLAALLDFYLAWLYKCEEGQGNQMILPVSPS